MSLDDLHDLSPAFDEGYFGLLEAAPSLARKLSQGGSAPARVREQLEAAHEYLGQRS